MSETEWNAVLDGFADANVYQTWAYGAVCWGEKQLSHLVLHRGGDPVAAAQLRVVRVPVIGSGIAYLRWGPLCLPRGRDRDVGVWRAVTDALIQEYVVRRGLILRGVPHVFAQDSIAASLCGVWSDLGFVEDPAIRPYRTFRVDLRPSLETLRRQLSSRWRRQLNIAERNQLEIVEGETDDLYRRFLKLYDEMMARKQFDTSVDAAEFGRIQQRLPASQKMLTLICQSHGLPVAGLVVGMVGNTAIYLLAATGDDGLDARGSYLLQWRAIQRLKERGIDWYDLGGANREVNPGVYTFKSGMGGEEATQVPRYEIGDARLSRLSVAVGEGIRRMARRARA
ncbi:MAG TPA: peptidoglycan bridge formation glycyltransferase FemA/FemB family protein [Vicinamibacterales bacterium]|nr:peptidoglycan bridge formation glycyltransferase FemA/FemB family protein [Vicinamibacterales bacterium]